MAFILICGPPAAGKSTYCRVSRSTNDLIIDFDEIDAELHGTARRPGRAIGAITRLRDRRIEAARGYSAGNVWVPMTLPLAKDRQRWSEHLGGAKVYVIQAPAKLCIRRIENDPARAAVVDDECTAVDRWWARYKYDRQDERLPFNFPIPAETA